MNGPLRLPGGDVSTVNVITRNEPRHARDCEANPLVASQQVLTAGKRDSVANPSRPLTTRWADEVENESLIGSTLDNSLPPCDPVLDAGEVYDHYDRQDDHYDQPDDHHDRPNDHYDQPDDHYGQPDGHHDQPDGHSIAGYSDGGHDNASVNDQSYYDDDSYDDHNDYDQGYSSGGSW